MKINKQLQYYGVHLAVATTALAFAVARPDFIFFLPARYGTGANGALTSFDAFWVVVIAVFGLSVRQMLFHKHSVSGKFVALKILGITVFTIALIVSMVAMTVHSDTYIQNHRLEEICHDAHYQTETRPEGLRDSYCFDKLSQN